MTVELVSGMIVDEDSTIDAAFFSPHQMLRQDGDHANAIDDARGARSQ
jgi:hypothetical protein